MQKGHMSFENYRSGDFYITLSRINTWLRDNGQNISEFARIFDLDEADLLAYFAEKGYSYDQETNSFKQN